MNSARAGPVASESMQDVFDIYTIIFLALAVFIFLRLRNVLGQRTGRERPPYDPYTAKRDTARPAGDNVVTLPPRGAEADAAAPVAEETAKDRWKGIAAAGTPLAGGLDSIFAADPTFDARPFVAGARSAYEMIVLAFAEGDRRTLKSLLSKEVYDGFDAVIAAREQQGLKVETRFVSIDSADIVAAEMRDRSAHVTIRFLSHLVSATRDKDGKVVEGSDERVTEVTDSWTFARDVSSRDPNWKLVATESGQ